MRRVILVGTYAAALAAGTVLSAQFWMQAFNSRGLHESGATMLLPGALARSVPALVLGAAAPLQPKQDLFAPERFSLTLSPLQPPPGVLGPPGGRGQEPGTITGGGSGGGPGGGEPGGVGGGGTPPPTSPGSSAGGGGGGGTEGPAPTPTPIPTPQSAPNASNPPPAAEPPPTRTPNAGHPGRGLARGHHKVRRPGARATPAVPAQPARPPSRPATPAIPAVPPPNAKASRPKAGKHEKQEKSSSSSEVQTPVEQSSGSTPAPGKSGADHGNGGENGNGHKK